MFNLKNILIKNLIKKINKKNKKFQFKQLECPENIRLILKLKWIYKFMIFKNKLMKVKIKKILKKKFVKNQV